MNNFVVESKDGSKSAVVHVNQAHVDNETIKQIKAITSHPSVDKVRIMPDCHKGNGCCVGFTCKLTSSIIPGLIGGDIGCGIALHPLPSNLFGKKNSLERIDRSIQGCVPVGNGWDKVHSSPVISAEQYAGFFDDAQQEAIRFSERYEEDMGVSIKEYMPMYSMDWLQNDLCARVGSNYSYDMRALGTLGGGNHYIEVNETVGEDGSMKYFLSVHSGSRNIGHKIAMYHSKVMSRRHDGNHLDERDNDDAEDAEVETFNDDEEVGDINLDPSRDGLSGAQAAAYFYDMIWAQTWAKMNRRCMLSLILHELNVEFSGSSIIESVHNYIDFRDLVIRKGAISAADGELCVLALNMRDGMLLCRGLGNEDWNSSAPHGCGRIINRKASSFSKDKGVNKKERQRLLSAAVSKFEAEMCGVHSSCIVAETLDERPSAYKDAALIIESIGTTVVIECQARTILNVKGY
jgi:tRNA-splicing ligase RtcB